MMMISRRPVSSPGRVEKYPPPFMSFLRSRSNGGSVSRSRSRSKGKSRASPLFVRRNKSAAAVTQEPSSPKVTCMGQVRVRRSKPKIKPEIKENPTRRRCEWIRNAFACKLKAISFWPKWGMLSFSCSQPKLKRGKEEDSPRSHPATEFAGEIEEEIEEEVENFRIPKLYVSPASSPPQPPPIDALLLTRSRSAPYRSSSLAYRFWEENKQREAESRKYSEQNVSSETAVKMNGYIGNGIDFTEVEFIRRPVLTRSKSEPARIGDNMTVLLPDEKEG